MSEQLIGSVPSGLKPEQVVDWDVYSPPGVECGFQDAWLALQGPNVPEVVWTTRNGGHWIPTTAELVQTVYSDHDRFSNRVYAVPADQGEKQMMIPINLDPPEHHDWRILLNSNLTPREVRKVEGLIRDIARSLTAAVASRGECDFIADVASQFPLKIFTSLIALPDERLPRFKWLVEQFTKPDGTTTMEQIFTDLKAEIGTLVDARMGRPADDMFSRLINGQIDGRSLTREEAVQMCSLVMIAGLDTVQNFLGFAVWHLATNPQDRETLARDRSAIPSAIEELLRRYPIVMSGRQVRGDMEFGGVKMRKGDAIVASTVLYNLDARLFGDPLNVDFDRRRDVHMTFGAGPHLCPGANLARSELRIALEEWLEQVPEFQVDASKQVSYHGGLTGALSSLPLSWKS